MDFKTNIMIIDHNSNQEPWSSGISLMDFCFFCCQNGNANGYKKYKNGINVC